MEGAAEASSASIPAEAGARSTANAPPAPSRLRNSAGRETYRPTSFNTLIQVGPSGCLTPIETMTPSGSGAACAVYAQRLCLCVMAGAAQCVSMLPKTSDGRYFAAGKAKES